MTPRMETGSPGVGTDGLRPIPRLAGTAALRPVSPVSARPFPRRDPATLARLKAGMAALGRVDAAADMAAVTLGAPAIDRHLPWGGLKSAALHEVAPAGVDDAGTATGFAAALLARAAALRRPDASVLWCLGRRVLDAGAPNPPALARFGLNPARLIVVAGAGAGELLWAMEEGLASRGIAAVIGEVDAVSLTESRRLQLAAETHGKTALLLAPACETPAPSAALTRWRIAAALAETHPKPELGPPRLAVELVRCRGGTPGRWIVEWRDATRDLAVAAEPGDRPAVPRDACLAG